MRIVICDDSDEEREYLARYINIVAAKRGLNPTVDSFDSAKKLLFALDEVKDDAIDLAFLDVLMPDSNGIDVGFKLRNHGFNGPIVYISRSPEYALRAFDVHAYNYVLKEDKHDPERLLHVIENALDEVVEVNRKILRVSNINEQVNIRIDEISYFEIRGRVVTVHYGKGKEFEFFSSMGKVENQMTPFGFVRVHRAFLVNAAAIEKFNGTLITLLDGEEIPIGRKKYTELCELFKDRGVTIEDK